MSKVNEPIEELEVLDLDDLSDVDHTRYDVVKDAYGPSKHMRIGSVNSKDMIEWLEDNDSPNPVVKRESGLRLLVKSYVNKKGERIPEGQREKYMEFFRAKDAQANGTVIAAALVLNGLRKKAANAREEAVKNGSGEANPAASPTDSPSQQAE